VAYSVGYPEEVARTLRLKIVASGTTDQVRGGKTLQRAFIDLVGPRAHDEEVLSWLGSSSS
jgi:ABC-2 type transport system ATP-binding protein